MLNFAPVNQVSATTDKAYPSNEFPIAQRIWYSIESNASITEINELIKGEFQPSLEGLEEWNTCLELGLI